MTVAVSDLSRGSCSSSIPSSHPYFETDAIPSDTVVKNPPAKQKTWVWSPGQKESLEKEMATHSSIVVWEIPWREQPGSLQSMGVPKSQTWFSDWARIHAILTLIPQRVAQRRRCMPRATHLVSGTSRIQAKQPISTPTCAACNQLPPCVPGLHGSPPAHQDFHAFWSEACISIPFHENEGPPFLRDLSLHGERGHTLWIASQSWAGWDWLSKWL